MMAKFELNKFKLSDNWANYEPKLISYLKEMKITLPERKKSALILYLENDELRMLMGICFPIKLNEKSFEQIIEIMRRYCGDYSKLEANNLKNLIENKSEEMKIENKRQIKISEKNSEKKIFQIEINRKLNKRKENEISKNEEKKIEVLNKEKRIEIKVKNSEKKNNKLNFEIENSGGILGKFSNSKKENKLLFIKRNILNCK